MPNTRSLDSIVGSSKRSSSSSNSSSMKPSHGLMNFKAILGLFVIFMFVVNKIFVDNVVSKIGGTVDGRGLSPLGTAVQGVCMVIMYMLLVYLIDVGIV